MNMRQRLLAVLNGQRPDAMPWFADLTYWCYARQLEGTLPPQYEGVEGFIQLHVDHKVGYYLGYACVWTETYDGVEVEATTEGDVTTTLWRTPVGHIAGKTQFLPATASSAPIQWPVRSPEDLRVLRYVADSIQVTPTYEGFESLKALADGHGHPMILPPRSPLSQMLAQWTGVTNLTYLLADAREDVEMTFEALGRAADGPWDAILAADTPLVEMGDNLTGEVVTHWFQRYQFDRYVRRVEQCHARGIKLGTHLDGTVRGILPLLAATGLDFVESITPKPCGDVAVEELRDIAGPDVILFGGIPGAMFAPPFTADDIRRQVEVIIEHHWASGKWVMGAADQVPPNGDLDVVTLVGELCEELCR
jgi:hypothetical protein